MTAAIVIPALLFLVPLSVGWSINRTWGRLREPDRVWLAKTRKEYGL